MNPVEKLSRARQKTVMHRPGVDQVQYLLDKAKRLAAEEIAEAPQTESLAPAPHPSEAERRSQLLSAMNKARQR